MEPTRLIKAVTDALRVHVKQERMQATILQRIDRLAIDPSVSLESAISKIERNICTVFDSEMNVAVIVDQVVYPFRERDDIDAISPDEMKTELYRDKSEYLVVGLSGHGKLSIRIEFAPESFLVIMIALKTGEMNASLEVFVRQLAVQLHLLVRTKNDRMAQEKERKIVRALLASRVSEFNVWAMLLSALIEYPPDWCPGKNNSEVVQFLIARHEERTMHLVAGEGSSSVSEFVLMNESMTGQAAREGWTNARVVRIDQGKEKYISYRSSRAQFALVVPVISDGKVISVLNLEADEQTVFNSALVSFYSEAADFLAPIVKTILERTARNRASEIRLQYVLSDMLQKFGGTFGHLVSQPFLICKLALGEMKYILRNDPSNIARLRREIDAVSQQVAALEKDCSSFVTKLPSFLDAGPKNVEAALRTRLQPLKNRAANHGIKISFSFEKSGQDAYASSLFSEHIFNICFNSFQQINEKIEKGKFPYKEGRIVISSKYTKSVSPSGDWKGVDFITIAIRDNGGGMSKELLEKTRVGHTTKVVGNGYAIPAAIEYFFSIGGELDFGNYRNGLQTVIKLQAYSPDRHESSVFIG